jgi:hypothetical protein
MIISIVQFGIQMGIQLGPGGDMMTLRGSMRECNPGVLKRRQGEATPPMCGCAVPAGCAYNVASLARDVCA